MLLRSAILALLAAAQASAQLKCALSGATGEDTCLALTDDNDHCVWCAIGGTFGFCVTEAQAEAMEQRIPSIACDRFSGTDDAIATDDTTPDTDDTSPNPDTDDTSPSDDQLPDNYWACLLAKDEKECTAKNCTWCDTKGGFGLCMTGPTGDAASHSDWFTCSKSSTIVATLKDPMDPSCELAYLQDPTEEGCTAATDMDGNPCEFCTLQGALDVCLTEEQEQMVEAFGIDCGESAVVKVASLKDPIDPSCELAYLQDPSDEGCKAATDMGGNPCEFCTLQGALDVCGESLIESNPYDPSCLVAFLLDPSPEACAKASDLEHNPCRICTLDSSSISLCLTDDQARTAVPMGMTCEDSKAVRLPNDFFECLQHSDSDDDCRSAACTWCNTEVGFGFCLASAAAEATKECTFFDCEFAIAVQ